MIERFDRQHYLDSFLRTEKGKAYKTTNSYKGGVKSFFNFMDEEGIENPSPGNIHDYLGYLNAQHNRLSTINLYMISLKLFFAHLASIGVYSDIYNMANPKIERPDRKHPVSAIPTDTEVTALRKAVPKQGQLGIRDLLMIDLAAYCGLEVGEIANIKIGDLVRDGEKYKLFVPTRKNNFVWVDPELARRLAAYAEEYNLEKYIFTDISHRGSKGHLCSSTISSPKIGRYMLKAQIKRENMTARCLALYHKAIEQSLVPE